jgi:hypothetical protein
MRDKKKKELYYVVLGGVLEKGQYVVGRVSTYGQAHRHT